MHLSLLPRSYHIFLFLVLVAFSNALRVAPTSPCLSVCGDATLTNGSDIVCNDGDFANSPTGRAFQECISCELNSTTFDPISGETDLQWLLYNLRYELSWCVWAFPNATNVGTTQCVTSFACQFFQGSIEDNLSPNASTFDYCTGFNTQYIGECHSCLAEVEDEFYISNFFTVLEAGCAQEPANGQILTLSGSVFSNDSIAVVNASTIISSFHPGKSGPLNLGAKVGIAVAGVVLILISTGCFIVCRGKRRRRAFLAERNQRNQNMIQETTTTIEQKRNTPSPTMPPSLQTRNFDWQRPDKYPTSSPDDSANGNEKYFPNYSSLYSSPVSASEGPGSAVTMNQVHPWLAGGLGDGNKEGPVGRMAMLREQSGDDIELQRIEPKEVDVGFIEEAAKRGFTTSPVRTQHPDRMM